jgi:hypothetical protein
MSAEPTARETPPGQPGATRYICIWPRCDWFTDLHFNDWLAEQGDLHPFDYNAGLWEGPGRTMQRWWDHVEAVLAQHLDDDHPGWTIEAVEAHATAWGILGLMEGD